MKGLKQIFFKVIEECSFIHLMDVELFLPHGSAHNDITSFFDFCLYNISNYDRHVLSTFDSLQSGPIPGNKTSVCVSDIQRAISLCKTLSIPRDPHVESLYTSIYQKHAKLLDSILDCCATKEKSLFFIFSPSFPDDILMLLSYRQQWIDAFSFEGNPFEGFSDFDMIVFLSGYTYLFKTKNPFKNTLNESLDSGKLYILYYG